MTEAEKLLQETKSAVVAETQMEDICVIDSDLRIASIPEQFKILGVEHDKDVRVIQFKLPKMYKDLDLSAFTISVNFLNAKNEKGRYLVTDKSVSGDQICFSWSVGNIAVRYKGNTRFIVCMRLTGSDGEIQKEFNTTLATMTVLEGLEVDNPVIEQGEKDIVAQLLQIVDEKSKEAVNAVKNAGTAQKTAVEVAGTQAVESVDNAKTTAAEAVEIAKTEAVQAVQVEGTKQTGSVTAEGTKQVKAVQDKGAEVLQSIPGDFQTAMASKLDKQQGIENKGKALVIGEDGNVVAGEVQGGGSSVEVDSTLTQSGKAADAKVVGDNITTLQNEVEMSGILKYKKVDITGTFEYVNGYYGIKDGVLNTTSNKSTTKIPCKKGDRFVIEKANQQTLTCVLAIWG